MSLIFDLKCEQCGHADQVTEGWAECWLVPGSPLPQNVHEETVEIIDGNSFVYLPHPLEGEVLETLGFPHDADITAGRRVDASEVVCSACLRRFVVRKLNLFFWPKFRFSMVLTAVVAVCMYFLFDSLLLSVAVLFCVGPIAYVAHADMAVSRLKRIHASKAKWLESHNQCRHCNSRGYRKLAQVRELHCMRCGSSTMKCTSAGSID